MAIEVDGKIYRNLPEQVEENANQIEDLKTLFSTLGTVMVYKGSVATYADLPTEDQKIGDVYNVIDTGNNYAWDGEGWDEIGSSVDLSNLVTLDSAQNITGAKTFIGDSLKLQREAGDNLIWYFSPQLYGNMALKRGNDTAFVWNVGTFIYPASSTFDLGTSANKWKNLYLSSGVYTTDIYFNEDSTTNYIKVDSGGMQIRAGGNPIRLQGDTRPYDDATFDLGSSSYRWKDIRCSGSVYFGSSNARIYLDGSSIKFSNRIQIGTIFPTSDKLNDLGNGIGWYWRDLWLYRDIVTVDENNVQKTIPVNKIATIKTLDSTAVNSAWSTTTLVTGFYKNEASLSTVAYNALKDAKSIFIKMSDNGIYPATFDYNYYKIKVIGDVDFSGGSITEVEIYYQ